MQRPQRIRIKNEYGNLQSLPEGKQFFQDLGGSGNLLLLGLGPTPAETAKLFPTSETVYFVEYPEFERQIPGFDNLPKNFKRITPDQIGTLQSFRAHLYKPNKKLYPSFWEPIISKFLIGTAGVSKKTRVKSAWLPGDRNSLLLPELSKALTAAGFTYRVIAPDAMRNNLLSLLDRELPEMVLSVNFNGLDSTGDTYFMLREAGIKTAVWMVDNPFHIISGIRSEYWKQVPLMVTDHWFIPRLQELGAENVIHLPLATDPDIFNPNITSYPGLEDRIVFVGRSSFPDKDSFFAGCNFTLQDLDDAREAIGKSIKPDFCWWAQKYGVSKFWPGKNVRQLGLKAEQSGLLWRITALEQAGKQLTLFGDEGWNEYLSCVDLHGPVDYYTTLPSIYAGAGITLNMTSPLLPRGLTQRNFDVWAAGGFLLTDYTAGLEIFPTELTKEVSFASPHEIPEICSVYFNNRKKRKELSFFWQQHIMQKHTYKERLSNILNFIN